MLRVDNRQTWDHLVDASIKTIKYLNGPEGGWIGPHMSPWILSRNLGDSLSTFIDEGLVKDWVEDLVITKTFNGLYVQKAILTTLATRLNASFRLATPDEESLGIDGYVGDTPYSIKPETYKTMKHLNETIKAKMIYYKKTSKGLIFEIEE